MSGVGCENLRDRRRVEKDWAGWAQVVLPIVIMVISVYVAMKSSQDVMLERLDMISHKQEVLMSLVQPIDKQVAINKLEIAHLQEELVELEGKVNGKER